MAVAWMKKRKVPQTLLDAIQPYFNQDLTVVDLGCGGGRVAVEIKDQFQKVIGIDQNSQAIHQATKQYQDVCFICGDYQSLTIWDELDQIDLVISNCAIRKDYTDLSKLAKFLRNKNLALRIQGQNDLADLVTKDIRTSLFYSQEEVKDYLDANVKVETYTQRFSSKDYICDYLEKIDIPSYKEIDKFGIRREYYIIT